MADAIALSVHEIEQRLRAQAEAVTRVCLPNVVKEGPYLKVGSIGGERGRSLVVQLQGRGQGLWTDYADGEAGGDMIDLVRLTMFGGDKGEAVKWAKSWLGIDDLDPDRLARMRADTAKAEAAAELRHAKEREAKIRGARALWLKSAPLTGDCPASRYLTERGIDAAALGGEWPGSLRYHPEVWNIDARVKLPCMLASMVTPDGKHVATHRTFLGRHPRTRAWVKADAAELGVPKGEAKKVLGPCWGAFIPLRRGARDVSIGKLTKPDRLALSEGIEDGLSAAIAMPALRIGAAYALRNIGFVVLPAMIDRLTVLAQRDPGAGERDALERAIARQQALGKAVDVAWPALPHKDWNDWLQALAQEAAA